MKRFSTDNISSSRETVTEAFTQAILHFHNTHDPDKGISPADIIFGRPFRDVLPIKPRSQIYDNSYVRPLWKELWNKCEDTLRTRFARQVKTLNMKTIGLPALIVDDTSRVQNQAGRFPGNWDKTGHVVQVNDRDQCLIKVAGSSRLTLRNREYLWKIQPLCQLQFQPCTPIE